MLRYVAIAWLCLFVCSSTTSAAFHSNAGNPVLVLQFGNDMPVIAAQYIEKHLTQSSQFPIVKIPFGNQTQLDSLPSGSVVLSLGNATYSTLVIDASEVKQLGSEGFIVQGMVSAKQVIVLAVQGNKNLTPLPFQQVSNGVMYGSYMLLEKLGFAFFHPLQAIAPSKLNVSADLGSLHVTEKPYWPMRGFHIHSMHPLELTNLLNGFGTGLSTDKGEWNAMLPEWNSFLEWSVANRQNRVEWVMLYADDWADYAGSADRQARMATLVDMCHSWGISAGADVPIALQQQHAWYMTDGEGDLSNQVRQIETRLDWLVQAGFDFLSTESGFSEFTHPDDVMMLAWMNATAEYLTGTHQRTAFIKIHCSLGQECAHYKNPWNGQHLDFNFLPYYATPELGIYPHTVQYYSFDDPAGGTYGNTNFTYMFDFLVHEMGEREVIYMGETAYWVNYDIDVPLFLPVYINGRVDDLRAIAKAEISANKKMQGQINFDSGWEWSYWLNDVITARAAWDPLVEEDTTSDAVLVYLNQIFSIFGEVGTEAAELVQQTIQFELGILVEGKVPGQSPPRNTEKLNGQAYIEGWDTWSQLGCLLTTDGCTQPNKLGLEELRIPFVSPSYTKVRPLLETMATNFTSAFKQFQALSDKIPKDYISLWNELTDTVHMTALRAQEVFAVYEYAAGWLTESSEWREQKLEEAKQIINEAAIVVSSRESNYRVPVDRIAGWVDGPTAYNYGYLWTVHSLFYFWRDLGKAYDGSADAISPCYLNIINPIDVAFGEGIGLNASKVAEEVLDKLGLGGLIGDCLEFPKSEPHYSFPPQKRK